MRTLEIKVPEEKVNKLQRYHAEVDARMTLINRIMETHKDDPSFLDSSIFKRYHDEYVELSTCFDEAKNIISSECIPAYLAPHKINWTLDYATCILRIDILCDCKIPELTE